MLEPPAVDIELPEESSGGLLREVIDFHLAGKVLKTRKVLMDIRRL